MSTSLSHGKPDRSPLLAKVLEAHGGLENWERVRSLRADIVLGGPFWSMLGWRHGELKLTASLDARREHITTNSAMCENGTTILRKDIDPSALEAASGRPPLTFRNFVRQHRSAFGAVTANA